MSLFLRFFATVCQLSLLARRRRRAVQTFKRPLLDTTRVLGLKNDQQHAHHPLLLARMVLGVLGRWRVANCNRPKSDGCHFLTLKSAKAKKKADKEKAGWGIAFSEFIARAGVGLDGAEEMDAATMQL